MHTESMKRLNKLTAGVSDKRLVEICDEEIRRFFQSNHRRSLSQVVIQAGRVSWRQVMTKLRREYGYRPARTGGMGRGGY